MIHALWKAVYWAVVLSVFCVACSLLVASNPQRFEKKATRLQLEWADVKLVYEEGE